MRFLADTNITAPAVRALRADGHDVSYCGERPSDPGDAALLAEAHVEGRILLTKDNDMGALVFAEGRNHGGVLLIDDLGSAAEEILLLRSAVTAMKDELSRGAFVRATQTGFRVAKD